MEERLQKCQQEVANLKDKYEASLNDINNYNAKYIEDMTEVCLLHRNASVLAKDQINI